MPYLTVDEVILLHDAEVPNAPLRDRDLLDSAVMAPRQSAGGRDAFPTIHLKAAALMRGIALNHAFADGNKRTALLATTVFYNQNGWLLDAPYAELIHLLVDIAVEHLEVTKVAEYLEHWVYALPDEDGLDVQHTPVPEGGDSR